MRILIVCLLSLLSVCAAKGQVSDPQIKQGEPNRITGDVILTRTLVLRDNTSIDFTGARIVFTGSDWSPAIRVDDARNVSVVGGEWRVGRNNPVYETNRATDVTFRDSTVLPDSGFVSLIRGSTNVTVQNVTASRLIHYFGFLEHSTDRNGVRFNNRNITYRNVTLTEGSTRESGIRVHATTGLLIENSNIVSRINKQTAIRLHDGSNFVVRNSNFVGGVGAGPLAEGDGGREWGIVDWLTASGRWLNNQTPRPSSADTRLTQERRRQQLALRLDNVVYENVNVDGWIILKAGLSNWTYNGGRVTNTFNNGWPLFVQYTDRYPETEEWTLPGDVLRPRPTGRIRNLTVEGNRAWNTPPGIAVESIPVVPPVVEKCPTCGQDWPK